MTMKHITIVFFLFLNICPGIIHTQYKIGIIPRVSPDKAVYQKIGYTSLEIRYGSPAVNNRPVWGNLVPYNKVWRAGANNATTFEISHDITINDQSLPAGKYALFVLPTEHDQWDIIFNSNSDQWGAWRYDETLDVLRVRVLPQRVDKKAEDLDYSIQSFGFNHARIILHWDYLQLPIEISTNYIDLFIEEIEKQSLEASDQIKGVIYLQGAEYLLSINQRLETANRWLTLSGQQLANIQDWNKQYYPLEYVRDHVTWTKAKLAAKEEKYAVAVGLAQQLLATENYFYSRKKETEKIDELLEEWKSQSE